MNKPNLLRLIVIANIVLILALSLNSILSIVSFEKVYRGGLIGGFQIMGTNLKQKIETAVNFGKPIDKFYGINIIIKHYMKMADNLTGISITLPDMTVLYSTNTDFVNKKIKLSLQPIFVQNPDISTDEHKKTEISEHGSDYYITLPIYYENKKWVGNVCIYFEKNKITQQVYQMVYKSCLYLLSVVLAALVVMVSLISFNNWMDTKRGLPGKNKKNYVFIIGILIVAQCTYTYINNAHFKQSYVEIVTTNIYTLSKLVKNEIDRVLKMGIPINRMKKMDVLLGDILLNVPECIDIKILDSNRVEQYRAVKDQKADINGSGDTKETEVDIKHSISVPLGNKKTKQGYALFIINNSLIDRQTVNLTIDALTVILISFLFGFEILIFSYLFAINNDPSNNEKMNKDTPVQNLGSNLRQIKFTVLRSLSFIFFFAEYVPLAFLPLFTKNLFEQNPIMFFGISKQAMLSLPISSYMLGVSIFVLVAGNMLGRFSLVRSFIIFGILQMAGSILSACSQDIVQLIIFRFISGLGYGGVLMAGITLIIQNTDHQDRTSGFGYWLIGNSTATICAVPIGSVIAQYMGFRAGVLISAAFSGGLILFILYLVYKLHLGWMFYKQDKAPEEKPSEKGVLGSVNRFKIRDLFCVFRDLDVFTSLFFASIPVQMALIGFLHYVFPLYLDSIGISQANIGRFTTLYGLAYIVCVPFVSKWSDQLRNERIFMILGNLIVGLVLILFIFADNIYLILIVIATIGMGNAFVTSTTGSYITLTDEAKKIGSPKLSSIFKTYQKLFTVIGPVLIGTLISMFGYMDTMTIIGTMIIFTLIVFIVFSRRLRGMD